MLGQLRLTLEARIGSLPFYMLSFEAEKFRGGGGGERKRSVSASFFCARVTFSFQNTVAFFIFSHFMT